MQKVRRKSRTFGVHYIDLRPQTSPERIANIRDWGKERAVPASGKPIGQQEIGAKKNVLRTRKVLV